MPNTIGKTLPDAQKDLQRASGDPDFESFSADVSGQERTPLFENLWKVCEQTVPAGARATQSTTILFGVVRLTEDCPSPGG